jgi:hypothetical protein
LFISRSVIKILHPKLEVVGSETEFLPGCKVDAKRFMLTVNSVIIHVLGPVYVHKIVKYQSTGSETTW